ncbi:MAG: glycine--tRNA ligase subunit beta, partial [Thermodesulfobacteriota bacterium]
MVGEFPSLQGRVGADYAARQGEEAAVAQAIEEHYLPVRAGGALPAGLVGTLVGVADKMDTLAGCFGIGATPTGTTDPFGLRRLAIGLLHTVTHHGLSLSLAPLAHEALSLYQDRLTVPRDQAAAALTEFIRGRLVNDSVSRGLPADAVEAGVAVGWDAVVDTGRRIEALAGIRQQPSFTPLAIAFKRVMNMVKTGGAGPLEPARLVEPAEVALHQAFLACQATAGPLLDRQDYGAALEAFCAMKEPVDAFFDQVLVMSGDEALRANRLALLTAIADLFLRVGDISKMQVNR